MSISNYTELQSSVANWLHRSDLAALIPDFITLAESRMSADIKSRSMEAQVMLSTVAGNSYITLPTDMVEMRRLVVVSDPLGVMRYVAADELTADYPSGTVGKPVVFTVIGGQLQVAPTPDAVYTLELTYQQKIPPLSNANPTNWLLTAWPDVYLYGALCSAQPFLANDERIAAFNALYQTGVAGINSIDWYSGSTLRVKAR